MGTGVFIASSVLKKAKELEKTDRVERRLSGKRRMK